MGPTRSLGSDFKFIALGRGPTCPPCQVPRSLPRPCPGRQAPGPCVPSWTVAAEPRVGEGALLCWGSASASAERTGLSPSRGPRVFCLRPGRGSCTPSSSPHRGGTTPGGSWRGAPRGLGSGGVEVLRPGELRASVLRACDLGSSVTPGPPHAVTSEGVTSHHSPAWSRLGTGTKGRTHRLSAPCNPSLGPEGTGEQRGACSQDPQPHGPEKCPSLCRLCGGQEPGSTDVPATLWGPCVPAPQAPHTLPSPGGLHSGPVCRAAPQGLLPPPPCHSQRPAPSWLG